MVAAMLHRAARAGPRTMTPDQDRPFDVRVGPQSRVATSEAEDRASLWAPGSSTHRPPSRIRRHRETRCHARRRRSSRASAPEPVLATCSVACSCCCLRSGFSASPASSPWSSSPGPTAAVLGPGPDGSARPGHDLDEQPPQSLHGAARGRADDRLHVLHRHRRGRSLARLPLRPAGGGRDLHLGLRLASARAAPNDRHGGDRASARASPIRPRSRLPSSSPSGS